MLKNVFVFFIVLSICSCVNNTKVHVNKGEAYFEYVEYSGSDTYYDKHQLEDDKFYNPLLPGFYPDPSICRKGDEYYLVTSTFSFFPGIPVFHSTDLVNWTQIGNVLDRPSQFKNTDLPVSAGIYAPAIAYNAQNDTFYLVTTFVGGGGNFVVTAKNPAGEWSDPIWLPEVPGIDPSLFFDDNGKAYLTNNQDPVGRSLYNGHKAIWIQEFDLKNKKMIGPRKMIRDGGHNLADKPIWIEGPHIYKVNGFYYLIAAEGGTSIYHSQVVFRSKDIWGPYETNPDNPILTQRDLSSNREYPVTNTGHADFVRVGSGEWYAMFLACRPYTENNLFNIGRETFMLPVNWDNEWPVILQKGEKVSMQVARPILYEKPVNDQDVMGQGNFSWIERFEDGIPGFDWLFLRTPREKWYTLHQGETGITLKLRDVNMRELKQPSFIGHRQQHHNMTIETKMVFEPSDSNELAGICLFQNEAFHLTFGVTQLKDRIHVVVQKATEGEDIKRNLSADKIEGKVEKVILAKKDISSEYKGKILLKAFMQNGKIGFAINTSCRWDTIVEGIDATYLSTGKAGGFVGTIIGLYASSKE